ncbi:actin organization and endocytosis protein [Rhizophlyctis rosea]|nr:actin organization and endocytosis protein [Rhizophlyctis rosea]
MALEEMVLSDAARNVLIQSHLPDHVLAQIWSLSAISNGSTLTYPEFCLSLYLAKLARTGTNPPPSLPDIVRQQVQSSNAAVSRLTSFPGVAASPMTPALSGNGLQPLVPTLSGNAPMSRSTSFQTPQGVTVVDGFAGPMVVQANARTPQQQGQQFGRQQGGRGWAIEQAEKAQYDSIFKVWDPQNSGFISGDRAREIFMQSGLPDNILAHIWTLADTQKHGKLNPDEFAVAMHLVYKKLNGFDLPQTLPQELIPPSTRDLDALSNLAKTQLLGDIQRQKQTGGLGSRTTSPFSSMSNLADPLGTFGIGSPNMGRPSATGLHQERQEQETKRKELAKQVEDRKKEIAVLRDQSNAANRRATEAQKEIDRLGKEVRDAQGDVGHTVTSKSSVEDQIASRGGDTGRVAEQSRDLEREIRRLLEECRGLEGRFAEGKKEVAKKKDVKAGGTGVVGSGSGSAAPAPAQDAQSRAQQLLAARMAALGLGGGVPGGAAGASSTGASVGGLDGDIRKIEEEKRRRERELDDVEGRVRVLVERVRKVVPSGGGAGAGTVRLWDPPIEERLKWEQGVGIKSKEVRKVVDDLGRVGGGGSGVGSRTPPSGVSTPSVVEKKEEKVGGGFPYSSSGTGGFPYGSTSTSASSSFTPQVSTTPFKTAPSTPAPAASSAPAPPPPPPPTSSLSATSIFGSSSTPAPTAPKSPTTAATSPSSVDDVVAQAQAAIKAAKERAAQRAAGVLSPGATSPGAANPFGAIGGVMSPAASTPAATSSSTTNPFGAGGFLSSSTPSKPDIFGTSPSKTDIFSSSFPAVDVKSDTGGGGGGGGGGEDEVEAAIRRLKQQELDLGIPDFRKGAGQLSEGDAMGGVVSGPAPSFGGSGSEGEVDKGVGVGGAFKGG